MVDYLQAEILILGCGNVLFGDDGFGPEVVKYLKENYSLPEGVSAVEAGLSVRGILFDTLLLDRKPKQIIVVDAVDMGRKPGEVFEIDLNDIPPLKCDDFSLHQAPTSNLLKEIRDYGGVKVRVIAVQVEHIPDEVNPGLSERLKKVFPQVCEKILKMCREVEYGEKEESNSFQKPSRSE